MMEYRKTTSNPITPGFLSLDIDASTYFLDTNVWISIASSINAMNNFLPWLQAKNAIAALSIFTVFELSRAEKYLQKFDKLLTTTAPRIYIPLLYDELSDLEMSNYPNEIELLWAPIKKFEDPAGVMFISTLLKCELIHIQSFVKDIESYGK